MIALDTSADFGRSGLVSSFSNNYTCTGPNLVLLACVVAETGDHVTSVTYGGVAMMQAVKLDRGDGTWQYVHALLAPATGTNALVVNGSSDHYDVQAASYTACRQASQPDVTATNTASGVDHITTAITVATPNSWVVQFVTDSISGAGATYTNLTERQGSDVGDLADSNGPLAAGSFSGTVTQSGVNQTWGAIAVALAPQPTLTLLERGTRGMTRGCW